MFCLYVAINITIYTGRAMTILILGDGKAGIDRTHLVRSKTRCQRDNSINRIDNYKFDSIKDMAVQNYSTNPMINERSI